MKTFYLLCAGRAGTCLGTMAFAGALPVIRSEWHIDAASAGAILTVLSISNALALFAASWLSDFLGARRVYLIFSWLGVLALMAFACFARSYSSALMLMTFVGLTQGGTYTPAMMLAMQLNGTTKRGFAVGAILAAGSLGYLLSVFISSFSALKWGAPMAFWLCTAGALAGAASGSLALTGYKDNVKTQPTRERLHWQQAYSIPALLLLAGYIAHCWELLGSWAWTPSMVMVSLEEWDLSPATKGLIVASAIHLAGMFSTLTIGTVSDCFNRASVLIFMGAAGAASSLLMGYCVSWGAGWTLMLVFCGSFFIVGDSGVLSAAIADNVPPEKLGSIMGIRSLMGFGIGSFAPLSFGEALDVTHSWERAYLVLAVGGAVACIFAIAFKFRLKTYHKS